MAFLIRLLLLIDLWVYGDSRSRRHGGRDQYELLAIAFAGLRLRTLRKVLLVKLRGPWMVGRRLVLRLLEIWPLESMGKLLKRTPPVVMIDLFLVRVDEEELRFLA